MNPTTFFLFPKVLSTVHNINKNKNYNIQQCSLPTSLFLGEISCWTCNSFPNKAHVETFKYRIMTLFYSYSYHAMAIQSSPLIYF